MSIKIIQNDIQIKIINIIGKKILLYQNWNETKRFSMKKMKF